MPSYSSIGTEGGSYHPFLKISVLPSSVLVPHSFRESYTKSTVRFSLQDYLKGKPRAKIKCLLQILDLRLAQLAMHPASCRGDFADMCKEIKGDG